MKVASVPSVGTPAPAVDPAKADRLRHAAREFEAVFVRQILSQAKIAGKSDAYGGMAVDAVASAVTAGSGLGVAKLIEDSLTRGALAEAASKSTKGPSLMAVPRE